MSDITKRCVAICLAATICFVAIMATVVAYNTADERRREHVQVACIQADRQWANGTCV